MPVTSIIKMQFSSSIVLAFIATAQLVAGHGAIVKAVGDAGGSGTALGSMSLSHPHSITFK